VIGAHVGRGWAPTGQIHGTVAEVAELLADCFSTLIDESAQP
jgi:hypothetical protein